MAKIINYGNAKPIYCVCCHSTYQWEYGDAIETVEMTMVYGNKIIARRLECPNCHYGNDIEFIKEEQNNETN